MGESARYVCLAALLMSGTAAADVDVTYDDMTDAGAAQVVAKEPLACSYAPVFVAGYMTKGDPAKRMKPRQFAISFAYDHVLSSDVPLARAIEVLAKVGKTRRRWVAAVSSENWPQCSDDCELIVTTIVPQADMRAIVRSKTVVRLFGDDCELPGSAKEAISTLLRDAPAFSKSWKPPAADTPPGEVIDGVVVHTEGQ